MNVTALIEQAADQIPEELRDCFLAFFSARFSVKLFAAFFLPSFLLRCSLLTSLAPHSMMTRAMRFPYTTSARTIILAAHRAYEAQIT